MNTVTERLQTLTGLSSGTLAQFHAALPNSSGDTIKARARSYSALPSASLTQHLAVDQGGSTQQALALFLLEQSTRRRPVNTSGHGYGVGHARATPTLRMVARSLAQGYGLAMSDVAPRLHTSGQTFGTALSTAFPYLLTVSVGTGIGTQEMRDIRAEMRDRAKQRLSRLIETAVIARAMR